MGRGYRSIFASFCSTTNNIELLHKIGVLQRYAMQLSLFTRELLRVSITVVLKEYENKVEGSSQG